MRWMVSIAAAMALAGCVQQIDQRESAAGCAAAATDSWRPAAGDGLRVEARAAGPDCERAVATLAIRNGEGRVLWAEAYPTEHVMVLADARDSAAMEAALAEWIAPETDTTMQTSAALPEWPDTAETPQNGEFPFYPAEGYDREAYNALRASELPLYCYVQGIESMACLVLRDGALEKIGLQSFPG